MLDIKELIHNYGPINSLKGISFHVGEGDSLCIAGANGSGKSTLLQLISTSLKPASGDIFLHGESVYKDLPATRRRIGMIFQDPDDQLFMPAVWEDVAFGIMDKNTPPAEAREKALAALKRVGGEHLADRVPHRLSGGEKYRVAIASVLIMDPQILILDEPTAALDPRARKNIIQLLSDLPCTKIIATHDLDMAMDLCNRVIFLDKGEIAAEGTVPERFTDGEFLQKIGMELPLRFS